MHDKPKFEIRIDLYRLQIVLFMLKSKNIINWPWTVVFTPYMMMWCTYIFFTAIWFKLQKG